MIFQVAVYFDKEHFKVAIPLAITAMLVMYTLNNSVASQLPKTSQIKFIDVWIIFGLFIHFLILILLVLIEHLPGNDNIVFVGHSKAELSRQNLSAQEAAKVFARKVLPIFEILFVVSYSIFACIIYYT